MTNNDNALKRIYDEMSKSYNMGSFDTFRAGMDNESVRKRVYDTMSQSYNMGSYDDFTGGLGYGQTPTAPTAPKAEEVNPDMTAEPVAEMPTAPAEEPERMEMPAVTPAPAESTAVKTPQVIEPAKVAGDPAYDYDPADIYGMSDEQIEKAYQDEEASRAKWMAEHSPMVDEQGKRRPFTLREARNWGKDYPGQVKYEHYRDASQKRKAEAVSASVGAVTQKYAPVREYLDSVTEDNSLTRAAKAFQSKTTELIDAPSKYEGRYGDGHGLDNFVYGLYAGLSDVDTYTAGVTDVARMAKVKNVAEKYGSGVELSPDEKALLNSYLQYVETQQARTDLPMGYQGGKGAAESIPFTVQMMLTSGLGALAERGLLKAARHAGSDALEKSMLKWFGKEAKEVAGRKVLVEAEEGLAKQAGRAAAEVALQTAAMPGTYSGIKADKIESYLKGEDYDFLDFARSFSNAMLETATEKSGYWIEKGLGKVTGLFSLGNRASRVFGDYIQSPVGEFLEEYVAVPVNILRSFNPLYDKESNQELRGEATDMLSWDTAGTTFLSVLPMSIFGGGVHSVQVLNRLDTYKEEHDLMSSFLQSQGATTEQARQILTSIESEPDAAKRTGKLAELYNAMMTEYLDKEGGTDSSDKAKEYEKKLNKVVSQYNAALFGYDAVVDDLAKRFDGLSDEDKQQAAAEFEANVQRLMNNKAIIDEYAQSRGMTADEVGKAMETDPEKTREQIGIYRRLKDARQNGAEGYSVRADERLMRTVERIYSKERLDEFAADPVGLISQIEDETERRNILQYYVSQEARKAYEQKKAEERSKFETEKQEQYKAVTDGSGNVVSATYLGDAVHVMQDDGGTAVVVLADGSTQQVSSDQVTDRQTAAPADLLAADMAAYDANVSAVEEAERNTPSLGERAMTAAGLEAGEDIILNIGGQQVKATVQGKGTDGITVKYDTPVVKPDGSTRAVEQFTPEQLAPLLDKDFALGRTAESELRQTTEGKLADLTLEANRQAMDEFISRIGESANVEHIASAEEAKAKNVPGYGASNAVYHNGKTYIFDEMFRDKTRKQSVETVIHELVAHSGTRALLGTKFDSVMDRVWKGMDDEMKGRFTDYAMIAMLSYGDSRMKGYNEMTDEQKAAFRTKMLEDSYVQRMAADEYVAHLAEGIDLTDEEKTLWQEIIDAVTEFINSMLDKEDPMTRPEVEQLIRSSYKAMRARRETGAEVQTNAPATGQTGQEVQTAATGQTREEQVRDRMAKAERMAAQSEQRAAEATDEATRRAHQQEAEKWRNELADYQAELDGMATATGQEVQAPAAETPAAPETKPLTRRERLEAEYGEGAGSKAQKTVEGIDGKIAEQQKLIAGLQEKYDNLPDPDEADAKEVKAHAAAKKALGDAKTELDRLTARRKEYADALEEINAAKTEAPAAPKTEAPAAPKDEAPAAPKAEAPAAPEGRIADIADDGMSRFQLIGQAGAARLDAAEERAVRMDNLKAAAAMEAKGLDSERIWFASGWQRGADGKWRYEIPDGKFTMPDLRKRFAEHAKNPRAFKYDESTFTLPELYEAPALYEAYPGLKNTTVRLVGSNAMPRNELGSYNRIGNEIKLNIYDLKQLAADWEAGRVPHDQEREEAYSEMLGMVEASAGNTLIHEIQHVVQSIEGFAKGGSPKAMGPMDHSGLNFSKRQNAQSEELYRLTGLYTEAEYKGVTLGEILQQEFVKAGEGNLLDIILKAHSIKDIKGKINLSKDEKIANEQLNAILAYYMNPDATEEDRAQKYLNSIDGAELRLSRELDGRDPFEMYRALAGEVEARNAAKRSMMTENERKFESPRSTEDTKDEDQIVKGAGERPTDIFKYADERHRSNQLQKEIGLDEETADEFAAQGLTASGGVILNKEAAQLKKDTGYKTPNEDVTRFSHVTYKNGGREIYLSQDGAELRVSELLDGVLAQIESSPLLQKFLPAGVHKSSEGKDLGPLRTNDEYKYTFDLDTSCPRTFELLNLCGALEKKLGRHLSQKEIVQVTELMRMNFMLIPCTYCYAENKRQVKKEYTLRYLETRLKVLGAKNEAEARKVMYGHSKGKGNVHGFTSGAYKTLRKWRDNEQTYRPSLEEYYRDCMAVHNYLMDEMDKLYEEGRISLGKAGNRTDDAAISNIMSVLYGIHGLDSNSNVAVRGIVDDWLFAKEEGKNPPRFKVEPKFGKEVTELWSDAEKYGISASSAKARLKYVPYTNELSWMPQDVKDYVNGMGGMRMHSSNDFRIDYFFDYLQLVADMAAQKMKGHTYTKQPDFVKLFGRTGIRINMSIAAYEDADGNIIPNVQEGFEWDGPEGVKELRKKYKNAGAMFMVTSINQLQFALDSDWVDMIIPFHESGLSKSTENIMAMRNWTNFTGGQSEKALSDKEKKEALKAAGVNISGKGVDITALYDETFGIEVLYDENGKRMVPHFFPGETKKKGVTIPGHNNDKETYMNLCRKYGVKPRFQGVKVKDANGNEIDVTEHPGYMKLIKETARIDSEQTNVQFNLDEYDDNLGMTPLEYGIKKMQEGADEAARNLEQIKSGVHVVEGVIDNYGVVDDFLKHYVGKNRPLKYVPEDKRELWKDQNQAYQKKMQAWSEEHGVEASNYDAFGDNTKDVPYHTADVTRQQLSDKAYMDAVEKGDMETASAMVREAFLKAYPNTKVKDVVYHGTSDKFNTFEKGKKGTRYIIGTPYEVESQGHFFSESEEDALGYAEQASKKGDSRRVIGAYLSVENPADLSEQTQESEELFKRLVGEYPLEFNPLEHDLTDWWQIADLDPEDDTYNVHLRERMREIGYDGIIFKEKNGHKSYFVTEANQIKSADPVTYDDNGNVIPLSERFSPSDDIRFQLTPNYLHKEDAKGLPKAVSEGGKIKPGDYFFVMDAISANPLRSLLRTESGAVTGYRDVVKDINLDNYYIGTNADFTDIAPGASRQERAAKWEEMKDSGKYVWHKSPLSDSEYLLDGNTGDVYRYSDHWGKLASCIWTLDGYAAPILTIAKANIKDFTLNGNPGRERAVKPAVAAKYGEALMQTLVNYRALRDGDEYQFTPTAMEHLEQSLANLEALKADYDKGGIGAVADRPVRYQLTPKQAEEALTEISRSNAKAYDPEVGTVRFQITKRTAESIDRLLAKNPNIDARGVAAFKTYVEHEETPAQLAMAKWFGKGSIRLPEDKPLVDEALKTCRKMKMDPMAYNGPGEIVKDWYERIRPEKEDNSKLLKPEAYPGVLTNKVDYGNGITVYNVADTREGQQAVRDLMNDHLTVDGHYYNCWCLEYCSESTGELNPEAWEMWMHYSRCPKRVAFYDGRIIAFCASDHNSKAEWWDLSDRSHGEAIPVTMPIQGDAYARSSMMEFDESSKELTPIGGMFSGNRKNGLYREWNPDGVLVSSAHYKGRKLDGLREIWRGNGQMMGRTNYKDGAQNGLDERWYENGQLELRAKYKDGGQNGLYEHWYEDGHLKSREEFSNRNLNGISEEWYENGRMKSRKEYKDNKIDGISESWYANGQIKYRGEFKDGEQNGPLEEWYENGQLASRAEYKDGWMDGLYERWYENGQIKYRSEFKDGRLNGLHEDWYENGQPASRTEYRDNMRTGICEKWHENGQLASRGTNDRGKQHGLTESWYSNGKREALTKFDRGVGVAHIRWGTGGELLYTRLSKAEQRALVEQADAYDAEMDAKEADALADEIEANEVRYSLVEDADLLERLNGGEVMRAYRAAQVIDGEIYPPMSAKVKGKFRAPIRLGRWEQSEENPEIADDKGYFPLNKGNGKTIRARYNPYFHSSPSPLNDQFSSAYERPNLIVMEVEVPVSELKSKFRAVKAKDTVGMKNWHAGPVSGKLPDGKKRTVMLSRWDRPIRIVPDSEVAALVADLLAGENLGIPRKVVTPSLAEELKKHGVRIVERNKDVQLQPTPEETTRYQLSTLASQYYEEGTKGRAFSIQESHQDAMRSLLILQRAIAREMGRSIEDFEDAYSLENAMGSANQAQGERYYNQYFVPLMDTVKDIMRKNGYTHEQVVDYMMAKHGLERNRVMSYRAVEKAMERMLAIDPSSETFTADFLVVLSEAVSDLKRQGLLAKGSKAADIMSTFDMDVVRRSYSENKGNAVAGLTEIIAAMRLSKDYSGLKALTGEENFTAAAEKMVKDFEEATGEKDVEELWKRTNAATEKTLITLRDGGLMSQSSYERTRDMFRYYIPLRGWSEKVAHDVWEYVQDDTQRFASVLKASKGRTSKADDPLATIAWMGQRGIMQANRNLMKQRFLNLAQNAGSSLLTVSDTWTVRSTDPNGEEVWKVVTARIPDDATPAQAQEAIDNFESSMTVLEAKGDAKKVNGKLNIPYRLLNDEAEQHAVVVSQAGRSYTVYVNGNPRAAQAVNGLLGSAARRDSKAMEKVEWFNRFMASNFTQRNPAFVLSNLSRDVIFSRFTVDMTESKDYRRRFKANQTALLKSMIGLVRRQRNGTLNLSDPLDRMYSDFVMNGGETGYTNILDVAEYKMRLERIEKGGRITSAEQFWDWANTPVEILNKAAENISRFAAFMTSRQTGRSMSRSIIDAKRISVNFNKKGTGTGWGAGFGRSWILFYNAAVQSLYQFGKMANLHPDRFYPRIAALVAGGAMMPLFCRLVLGLCGGDPDDYDQLPDSVRRNNVCIPLPRGKFLLVPLPIELRAFYGMGEITTQWLRGKMKYDNIGLAYAAQVGDLMPVDITALLNSRTGQPLLDVLATVGPDALRPAFQVARNADYFGLPIYRKNAFNENMPDFTKAYKGTGRGYVSLAEFLNEKTGGDKYTKGWLNANPALAEYTLNAYFGGTYKTMQQTIHLLGGAAKAVMGEESDLAWHTAPVFNRLVGDTRDSRVYGRKINNAYYEYKGRLDEYTQRLNGYMKEAASDPAYMDKYLEAAKSPDFMAKKVLNMYDDRLAKIKTLQANGLYTEREASEKALEIREEAVMWLEAYYNDNE